MNIEDMERGALYRLMSRGGVVVRLWSEPAPIVLVELPDGHTTGCSRKDLEPADAVTLLGALALGQEDA